MFKFQKKNLSCSIIAQFWKVCNIRKHQNGKRSTISNFIHILDNDDIFKNSDLESKYENVNVDMNVNNSNGTIMDNLIKTTNVNTNTNTDKRRV